MSEFEKKQQKNTVQGGTDPADIYNLITSLIIQRITVVQNTFCKNTV